MSIVWYFNRNNGYNWSSWNHWNFSPRAARWTEDWRLKIPRPQSSIQGRRVDWRLKIGDSQGAIFSPRAAGWTEDCHLGIFNLQSSVHPAALGLKIAVWESSIFNLQSTPPPLDWRLLFGNLQSSIFSPPRHPWPGDSLFGIWTIQDCNFHCSRNSVGPERAPATTNHLERHNFPIIFWFGSYQSVTSETLGLVVVTTVFAKTTIAHIV